MWSCLLLCRDADTISLEMFKAEFFWVSFIKRLCIKHQTFFHQALLLHWPKSLWRRLQRTNWITRRQWISLGPLNGIYDQTATIWRIRRTITKVIKASTLQRVFHIVSFSKVLRVVFTLSYWLLYLKSPEHQHQRWSKRTSNYRLT